MGKDLHAMCPPSNPGDLGFYVRRVWRGRTWTGNVAAASLVNAVCRKFRTSYKVEVAPVRAIARAGRRCGFSVKWRIQIVAASATSAAPTLFIPWLFVVLVAVFLYLSVSPWARFLLRVPINATMFSFFDTPQFCDCRGNRYRRIVKIPLRCCRLNQTCLIPRLRHRRSWSLPLVSKNRDLMLNNSSVEQRTLIGSVVWRSWLSRHEFGVPCCF